ncbi:MULTISPECIES: hypothetical protein [Pseudomonas]|uniref:hypothetical protein n=1 Tax=Pseudomonas TaxID=286 RepID=UPI001E55884A|nr:MULTISPECIES: hypothetical protein [Pseudomonas]MCE0871057.1 hypothetical protein [Pseudomonas alloputida]MDH1550995.1 hypothetical protein [Pseudomonas juntendi]
MTAVRQIMYFPGSQSVPGYPKLDVTDAELDVANIPSLKYWPGLFDWDVSEGVISDRMNDVVIPSYAASVPANNFVTLPNGKKGYKVNAVAQALAMPVFNTGGSFTIGCVCDLQVGFGSLSVASANTDAPAPWYIYSDLAGSGAITASFGNVVIAQSTSAAWPQKLSSTKLTALVLIFDRDAGKISVRYNGVEMWSYTNAAVKNLSLFTELYMGALRVAGASAQVATRPMASNAFTAFEAALSGTELAALERMLLEAAA